MVTGHNVEGALVVEHPNDHAPSDYRLHGYLPATSDRAVALRIVALVHRRGVPLLDLEFRIGDVDVRGEFAATIRADGPRARTISRGLDAMIDVEDVSLCRL